MAGRIGGSPSGVAADVLCRGRTQLRGRQPLLHGQIRPRSRDHVDNQGHPAALVLGPLQHQALDLAIREGDEAVPPPGALRRLRRRSRWRSEVAGRSVPERDPRSGRRVGGVVTHWLDAAPRRGGGAVDVTVSLWASHDHARGVVDGVPCEDRDAAVEKP